MEGCLSAWQRAKIPSTRDVDRKRSIVHQLEYIRSEARSLRDNELAVPPSSSFVRLAERDPRMKVVAEKPYRRRPRVDDGQSASDR